MPDVLVARPREDGAVALRRGPAAFVDACTLVVCDADGQRWAFGAADPDVRMQQDGRLAGWRIVRGGLDLRLVFGVSPGGDAAVFRLEATNTGTAVRALALGSRVVLAEGAWEPVDALGACTAALGGAYAAHTFVPDDGRWLRAEAGGAGGALAGSDEAGGLWRQMALGAGATEGWTVAVGVGATPRAALGAVFPHLSGQRSRAALAAARGEE